MVRHIPLECSVQFSQSVFCQLLTEGLNKVGEARVGKRDSRDAVQALFSKAQNSGVLPTLFYPETQNAWCEKSYDKMRKKLFVSTSAKLLHVVYWSVIHSFDNDDTESCGKKKKHKQKHEK